MIESVRGSQGRLRLLTIKDVLPALELSAEAGWNQTADDWRMLIDLAPQSCMGIEVDGELAATTTLLCYGQRLAWIGMVLTKIKFRGRGLARRLLTEALTMADQMKIESVKLDATDQGQPLYKKSGFRVEQPVERWARAGIAAVISPSTGPNSLPKRWQEADYEAFGEDRSALIAKLAQHESVWSHSKSFLLARSGSKTAYVGPCVSEDAQVARSLIAQCAQRTQATLSWDLLSQNKNAVTLAKDFGFTPRRHLTRMVRGKDLRGREESIYALAGFEFG